MRLHIAYVTRFSYAAPVRESVNELRAAPLTDDRQTLVDYRVTTTPPARVHSSVDYWGTRVDAFGIREPHTQLEIRAESTVETRRTTPPMATARMASLDDPGFVDAHVEYLEPSAHATWGAGVIREATRRAQEVDDDVVSVVLALHRSVGTAVAYTPGSTYVGVEVEDVLHCGQGVCQDFAHLLVALCRSLRIPARYVSGYFFAVDDATGAAGPETDAVQVQTHAWAEVAVPGIGWWALDPTNRQEVGERHVKIGHGRDYDDVPPLKGVFSGPPEHDLDVAVHMRRTQAQAAQQ